MLCNETWNKNEQNSLEASYYFKRTAILWQAGELRMEIEREARILGPREEYSGPIEKVADIFPPKLKYVLRKL